MIEIPLTKNKIAIVDEGYYFLTRYKWSASENAPGRFYAVHALKFGDGKHKNISMHHCIVGKPLFRGMVVDHINGDSLDNRLNNLRIVSVRENNGNTAPHRNGKPVGIWKDDNRWKAHLWAYGRTIYIGSFKTEKEAIEARKNYLQRILSEGK